MLGGRGKATLNGYASISTIYAKQDLDERDIKDFRTITDGGLTADVGLKIFTDFTVGMRAMVDTKYSDYYWQYDDETLQELYVYLQNNYARVEFGNAKSIAGKMQVSAPDVGVFGVNNSSIYRVLLMPSKGAYPQDFFLNPSTDVSFMRGRERVSIVSSNRYKFQVGASYAFAEKSKLPTETEDENLNGEYSVSAKFSSNFLGNNHITLTGGYSHYDKLFAENFALADARDEISGGLNLFVKGVTFGASAMYINEKPFEDLLIANEFQYSYDGWAYNAGLAFEIGPWATSISYHGSIAEADLTISEKDISHMAMISLRRNFKKNFTFYASFAGLMLESENAEDDNKGFSVIIGTALKF